MPFEALINIKSFEGKHMEIIQKVKDNLTKSSGHYSGLVSRKKRDMEIYSGNFWTQKLIEDTDRNGRLCKSFTQYPKYANAAVSPFSKSPYHAEIEDPDGIYGNIQSAIDDIENDNNSKYSMLLSVRHACITGVGYFIMSTNDNNIVIEAVRDVSQVALDPNTQELDAGDAEWCAIVNYISINKAKRLYGTDVVNYDNSCILSNFGDQWQIPSDSVAIVTYYELNESGTIDMYKLCGNKVIKDKIVLNISRIPVFRVCFNEIIRNNKVDYNGIVDMTADIQFGINMGYSTLLERANRSPKANFMMPAKAIDGLDEYYKKLQTKESLVCLYNGDVAPTPLVENYQTQDLMTTIQVCNDLMSSTIGIPSQGINPAMNSQTATEILIQQNNSESNINSLYENSYNAIFQFNKTLIELLCWQNNIDELPTFKLINGPTIITKLQKRRQELLAVSQLVDEKSRKIIAKQYIETLDKELKEPLLVDIIANTDDVNFISDSDQEEDPRAVHVMRQMSAVLEETQNELEAQVAANAELKKQLDQLQLEILNQKQQIIADIIKHNDDVRLKEMQMQIDAQKASVDVQNKVIEGNSKENIEQIKLQKELLSLQKEKMKIANEAINEVQ